MELPTELVEEALRVARFACDCCAEGYEWDCKEGDPYGRLADFGIIEEFKPEENNHHRALRLVKVLEQRLGIFSEDLPEVYTKP